MITITKTTRYGAAVLGKTIGLALLLLLCTPAWGQRLALKTDAVQWATRGTLNLGAEVSLHRKLTLNVDWGYNPWTGADNRKLKYWMVRPEVRWWLCEGFRGHFLGLLGTYSQFNAGGVKLPFGLYANLEKYRYEGSFYDVGVSYGYQFSLAPRWNLELSVGVGYRQYQYRQYLCPECGLAVDSDGKPIYTEAPLQQLGWLGPTKVAVSLIFIIK